MDCKNVLEKIDELYRPYLQVWEDVCRIESPTVYKPGVDAVGNYFIAMAQKRGWQVEIDPQETAGDAICITLNPHVPGKPVTLSGHMDTVHPVGLFGSNPVHRDETHIYGPGVADCKGGVVAAFLAMDALDQCGFRARPVQLILQSDEETSSKTSGKKTIEFMCRKAVGSIAFLNTEECENFTAVILRKGILRYRFHITGKAVHASICYKGANAVAEAAHKILQLEKWKDKNGLTCNCGVISGGTVVNTVAEACSFLADIRFATQAQYAQAEDFVRELAEKSFIPGCTCRLEKISERPAMEKVQKNLDLLEAMNRIYEANGLPVLQPKGTPGGSDAAYTTIAGIPTVDSIGVEGEDVHAIREKARLTSLAESAKRMAAVAACL